MKLLLIICFFYSAISFSKEKEAKLNHKNDFSKMSSDQINDIAFQKKKSLKQVAVGAKSICINTSRGIHCWGEALDVPTKIRNVMGLAAGHSSICAHNDEEVYCWRTPGKDLHPGHYQYSSYQRHKDRDTNTPIRTFSNITDLDAGQDHFCVIADQKVHCWGEGDANWRFNINPPNKEIKSPAALALGMRHSCVLMKEGVKCWGDNKLGQLNVPKLNKPYQISSQRNHTCVLDADGVKCWGADHYGQSSLAQREALGAASISVGDRHTCALMEKGIKCWGYNVQGQLNVPSDLQNVSAVYADLGRTCALDKNGFQCWGKGGKQAEDYRLNYIPGSNQYQDFEQVVLLKDNNTYCFLKNKKLHCKFKKGSNYINVEKLIPAGENAFCLIREKGAYCKKHRWDEEEYGEWHAPFKFKSKDIKHVDVSGDNACAIIGDLIKCGQSSHYGPNYQKFDSQKNGYSKPYKIAVLNKNIYILDEEGVKGYKMSRRGSNDLFELIKRPIPEKFKNIKATSIKIGNGGLCIIVLGRVKCWDKSLEIKDMDIEDATELSLSKLNYQYGCAIHEQKVTCWRDYERTTVREFKNPRSLTISKKQACIVDDQAVKCWFIGKKEKTRFTSGVRLKYKSCLAEKEKESLKCFKDFDTDGKLHITKLYKKNYFSLSHLSAFLNRIQESSTYTKSKFAEKILLYTGKYSELATRLKYANEYQIFKTLDHLVRSNDSKLYRKEIIPQYENTMNRLNSFNDIQDLSIIQTHLKIIEVSLSIANEFLNPKEKRKVKNIKRLIAKAYMKPQKTEQIKSLRQKLNEEKELFKLLETTSKASFLAQIMKDSLKQLEKTEAW